MTSRGDSWPAYSSVSTRKMCARADQRPATKSTNRRERRRHVSEQQKLKIGSQGLHVAAAF